jgi:ABC-type transport system substrate-binding protein
VPPSTTAPPTPAGGDIIVGLDSEPPTLDPAANSLSLANGSVYTAIYETLYAQGPSDPEPVPYLAESVTPNADFTVWTLKLKAGVTFQDGTPLNADAVIFNLTRQQSSLYNGASLAPLASTKKIDDLTVELDLKTPWVAVPSALAGIVGIMVSPTAAASPSFGRNPIGTGPYKFDKWDSGEQVVVKRYDAYWGEDKANLDSITFRFIPLEATRIAAFGAGEIDAYTTIVQQTADKAKSEGSQVVAPPPTGYGLILLNTARPPLNDVRVRQALEIGYDRDAIVGAYTGQDYATAAFSPFVKDSLWWVAPTEPEKYDPDKAKALLDDYGQPVSFTLMLLKGSQDIEDSVRATIEYWNDLGMDVKLQIVNDLATYVTAAVVHQFDAIGWVAGSTGDPDSVLYNAFHTGAAYNFMSYSNPDVDAALDAGRATPDEPTRRTAYDKVQQQLRIDQPVLITSHGQIYIVASDRLAFSAPSFFFPARTVTVTG